MRERAMERDFSWDRAAGAYEDLYLQAYRRRRGPDFTGRLAPRAPPPVREPVPPPAAAEPRPARRRAAAPRAGSARRRR
jgi:hypothetical protein